MANGNNYMWIILVVLISNLVVSVIILRNQTKEKYVGSCKTGRCGGGKNNTMSWMMLMLSDNSDIGPVPIGQIKTLANGKLWVSDDGKMTIDMVNNKITIDNITYNTKSIGDRISWQAPKGKKLYLMPLENWMVFAKCQ